MLSENNINEHYKRAKLGDKLSEEQLFQNLRVRFSAIAKQRLKEDYSEDIVHDACLTILEQYKGLSSEVEFKPWAYKVLRNKIGSYMRNSRLRNSKLQFSENIESVVNVNQSDEALDLKLKIINCLRKLSEFNDKYITIINLKNYGYSTNEICDKLNISSSHLYVILHRCRTLLYNCLYNSEEEL